MRFLPSDLHGVHVVELDPTPDSRGYFMRTFCRRLFGEHGLINDFCQCNMVWNKAAGTLRGMHYTVPPAGEVKVVQCVRGSAYDVLLDLRPASQTFRQWQAFELTAEKPQLLYIPKGVAHGYQTLEPDTCLYYMMSEEYVPGIERGVRWDDPAFAITWPLSTPLLSDRDKAFPDYTLPGATGKTPRYTG